MNSESYSPFSANTPDAHDEAGGLLLDRDAGVRTSAGIRPERLVDAVLHVDGRDVLDRA
jgi:hypothetical protein